MKGSVEGTINLGTEQPSFSFLAGNTEDTRMTISLGFPLLIKLLEKDLWDAHGKKVRITMETVED